MVLYFINPLYPTWLGVYIFIIYHTVSPNKCFLKIHGKSNILKDTMTHGSEILVYYS